MIRIPVLSNVNDLGPGRRKVIVSRKTGRSIVLIRHPRDNKFFCMDALCYHMGGPLGETGKLVDIEEVGLALQCPDHAHVISLEDGGLIREGHCAPVNKNPSECRKQRTHQVEVDDQNRVWVLISGGNPMESDKYNISRSRSVGTIGRSSTVPSVIPSRKRPSVVHRSRSMLQFRSRKLQATEAIMRKMAMKNNNQIASEGKMSGSFSMIPTPSS